MSQLGVQLAPRSSVSLSLQYRERFAIIARPQHAAGPSTSAKGRHMIHVCGLELPPLFEFNNGIGHPARLPQIASAISDRNAGRNMDRMSCLSITTNGVCLESGREYPIDIRTLEA